MDLELKCNDISARGASSHMMNVTLSGVDSRDVLNAFSPEEITQHFDLDDLLEHISAKDIVHALDVDDLLECIGEKAAREYFGIEASESVQ
jgi:hypothetical protein